MEALRDAFMRADHALQCDERKEYQEAYKGYLATNAFIMNVLGQKAGTAGWCDELSLRMLDLAKQCIEAAGVVGRTAQQRAVIQQPALQPASQPASQPALQDPTSLSSELLPPGTPPSSGVPSSVPGVPGSQPGVPSSLPVPSTDASASSTLTPLPSPTDLSLTDPVYTDDVDIFSILDSLPDIPANKPKGNRRGSNKSVKRKPPDWQPPGWDPSDLEPPPDTSQPAQPEDEESFSSQPDLPAPLSYTSLPTAHTSLPHTDPSTLLPPPSGHGSLPPPSGYSSLPPGSSLSPPPGVSDPGRTTLPARTLPHSSPHLSHIVAAATNPHQEVRKENSYYSSQPFNSLGENIGHYSSPVFLKVSPMDRALRENEALAAKYTRQSQRGGVRPTARLELVRAQQENLMLARELEKTLERKSTQRKLRLEQEEYGNFGVIGTFEAILTSSTAHLETLYNEIKSYDHLNGWVPAVWLSVLHEEEQMRQFVTRCLREPDHPLYKALGEAQFNTYNRLAPLNKKVHGVEVGEEYDSLHPGIELELRNITTDITLYVLRLTEVFKTAYPKFDCEAGLEILNEELTRVFFQPVWKCLIALYSFLSRETEQLLEQYFVQHSEDGIDMFDIQDRYKLGEGGYSRVMEVVREVPNTTSPLNKLSTLVGLGEQITLCIKEHYLTQGLSEMEAAEIACLGADDMIPVCIYVVVKSRVSNLLAEINCLEEIVPDQYLLGAEGYFLMTIRAALFHIVEKAQEAQRGGEWGELRLTESLDKGLRTEPEDV